VIAWKLTTIRRGPVHEGVRERSGRNKNASNENVPAPEATPAKSEDKTKKDQETSAHGADGAATSDDKKEA